ncbi:MAG TPA: hypothetical protein VNM24_08990 [Burkholderiales bacterium]|jgi:hypothetical protein|nr:hypothetical protein [Burkholderiales bacterium]
MKDHWLVRPATIRLLWALFVAALVAVVLVQLVVPVPGHFGIDGRFGFGAWFGFGSCATMILVAKLLGALLKRKDTYYDD